MNEPLALPFDIREDESTSTTFDVLDDSIPIVEGVPTNTFRWLEELSLREMSFYIHGGPSTLRPPILFQARGTLVCYRSNQVGMLRLFRWSS